ncbi:hypothetical protein NDU88_005733 [Pleurodeles waltl]|uniref:Uncharacterized protein n=1 Tax=Pleurodeles waltl TaxID=8319 RepID=A0AAV7ULX2_PLEWA|nr:hypothetical protein NDU88_005733 [Pleurodeles waltl]
MPGGKSWGKNSGKSVRQSLFSEALLHSRTLSSAAEVHPTTQPHNMADQTQETTLDRILQGILAMDHRLEEMDNAMASLMAETKSMRLDITKNGVSKDFYNAKDLRFFLEGLQTQSIDTTNPTQP